MWPCWACPLLSFILGSYHIKTFVLLLLSNFDFSSRENINCCSFFSADLLSFNYCHLFFKGNNILLSLFDTKTIMLIMLYFCSLWLNLMSIESPRNTLLHCMVSFQVSEVQIHSLNDCVKSESESCPSERRQTMHHHLSNIWNRSNLC